MRGGARRAARGLAGGDLQLDERWSGSSGELRRYKNEEMLRIAIHDIAGSIDLASVAAPAHRPGRGLPRALPRARRGGGAGQGARCRRAGSASSAWGSWAGASSATTPISTSSSSTRADASQRHERYARLAQRFLSFLQMPLREGRLYQIDTRLRPCGNQGALVDRDRGVRALPHRRGGAGRRGAATGAGPQPALGAAGAAAGALRGRRPGPVRGGPAAGHRPGRSSARRERPGGARGRDPPHARADGERAGQGGHPGA